MLFSTLMLAGTPVVAAAAPRSVPMRIMSASQCIDLMLLMLVPKTRIASISWLAHDPAAALMPGADVGVAVNHGTVEEALSERPDLILASRWATPTLRTLAPRAGARVVLVDDPTDFVGVRMTLLMLGDLLGVRPRAEALVSGMDRTLAELSAFPPRRLSVLAWDGVGAVPGAGTMTNSIIRAAGARNLADQVGGNIDVERLLALRPDALLRGVEGHAAPSLHRASARNPLVQAAFVNRQIDYPQALYSCGLPQSADAALALRRALDRVPPQ